ncbi:SpoIID/LytB domain-containing protein [Sutcliffiella horikoshii]|uniref:SpoIID/LytB domain-containing protein n=1 Tax=Sutcliffiella horikoshii TaxID=79883 RepID=UPI001F225432|nr:SpoIID/LytB domain-containing protein [Sutcliffiella horikoshii]MCG1021569.1 SpoIID/LytB domain-containing protein [Sutcliffiella horikoshii]
MQKKVFLFFCLLFFFIKVDFSNAEFIPKQYVNPVTVELTRSNTINFTPAGTYKIKNLQNNTERFIKPNQSLTITNNSGNSVASFGSITLSSTNGFEIIEMTGNSQIVVFSASTPGRRDASTSGQILTTFENGEAAEYVSTHNNSQGVWYIVKRLNGQHVAVLVNNNVQLINSPALSTINTIIANNDRKYRGSAIIHAGQFINKLDMQSYLKGVLPNEMPASFHLEALKAQAVAARSYAYVKNARGPLSNTTSSQVYRGYTSENSRTNQAVDETDKKVVRYNNNVIETFFFSTSGGRTANVGDVWNSNQSSFPYLVTVEDAFEVSPHSNWTETYNSSSLLTSFGINTNVPLYNVSLEKTGANGEVSAVTLHTGNGDFRRAGNELTIRQLFPTSNGNTYGFLKSNWFDLTINTPFTIQLANGTRNQLSLKGQQVQLANSLTSLSATNTSIALSNTNISKETDPQSIIVNGKGWGHRIGMSQYGAQGYANNGWNYDQIIKHYYRGTVVNDL